MLPELASDDVEKKIVSKPEVVAYLRRSLAAVKTARAHLKPGDLERKVKIAGETANVDGMYLRILCHDDEHMGQVDCLRARQWRRAAVVSRCGAAEVGGDRYRLSEAKDHAAPRRALFLPIRVCVGQFCAQPVGLKQSQRQTMLDPQIHAAAHLQRQAVCAARDRTAIGKDAVKAVGFSHQEMTKDCER